MNDLWKEENLHQVLRSQGVVWTTQPNPFKEGEAALVADDREKRLNWKMGDVRQLIIGRDGRYQAAVVQVKSRLLTRSICKLYKLEIYAEADNLPPITSLPKNSNEEYDNEMQNCAVELIN